MRSRGLQVPAPVVSDIPQSSASGIPSAWKNSITSGGVGAAPTLHASSSSSPRWLRSLENTASSAFSTPSASSEGTSSPACSSRTFPSDASNALSIGTRCSEGSAAIICSRPAFSFSQIRGTAKNQLGRTSGRYSMTFLASGQHVIVNPHSIGR